MKKVMIWIVLSLLFFIGGAFAEPTTITVRVKTKDAKFLGTSMGGALITIKDIKSGTVLAEGTTQGGTGNTDLVMKTPHKRGVSISDENAAKFTAVVDIDDPTYVEISAQGPMKYTESANKVSITQWLIPGKNITAGDGLVLELPGFAVMITSPGTDSNGKKLPQTVTINATVKMMCGCPLTPGGLWDSEKFEIMAVVKKDGVNYSTVTMDYAGTASRFTRNMTITEPGAYDIVVYAFDPTNGNTGLDKTTVTVR